MPVDGEAEPAQQCRAALAGAERNHRILRAVRHEYRLRDRASGEHRCRLVRGGQVGRQRDESGERRAAAQARGQRDRAALREAGEQDPRCRHAARVFARDQCLDLRHRFRDAGFVGAIVAMIGEVDVEDVVPRAHAHAAVDRHRAHRRVRKHEAQRAASRDAPARARSARSRGRRRPGRAARPRSMRARRRFRVRRFRACAWFARVNGRDCARVRSAFPLPLWERVIERSESGVRDVPSPCAQRALPSPTRGEGRASKMRLRRLRQRRVRLCAQFRRAHQHLRRRVFLGSGEDADARAASVPGAAREVSATIGIDSTRPRITGDIHAASHGETR